MNNQDEAVSRRSFLKKCFNVSGLLCGGWVLHSSYKFLSAGNDSMYTRGSGLAAGIGNNKRAGEDSLRTAENDESSVEISIDSIPENGSKVLSAGSSTIMVVHTGNGYTAIDAKCTHLGCLVKWDSNASTFNCPCHGGKFSLNGDVIEGPPPAPLKTYTVNEDSGKLRISVV